MKRKDNSKLSANYLENVPIRNEKIDWTADEKGMVTLHIHNTGFFNRLCQKLFHRPEYSHIHLDENGSFIWPLTDGKTSIMELGKPVKERFGEACEPLYPRLAEFFRRLESYGFVSYKEKE